MPLRLPSREMAARRPTQPNTLPHSTRKKRRVRSSPPTVPGLGRDYEHYEQEAFFDYLSRVNHPATEMTFAVPNQAVALLRMTKRLWFFAEGVKGGVPDIFVDHPTDRYHGLRIEMKRPGETPTDKQLIWHERLRARGYRVDVCYSAVEALKVWCDYLGLHVTFS